jgi:hypothetical protein
MASPLGYEKDAFELYMPRCVCMDPIYLFVSKLSERLVYNMFSERASERLSDGRFLHLGCVSLLFDFLGA